MKAGNFFIVLGIACFFAIRAHASVDYAFLGYGFADLSGQLSVTIPTDYSGGEHTISGMWVGQMNIEDTVTHEVFVASCLSPAGGLTYAVTPYDKISPDAAKFGLNPSTWSTTGGIENAVYIWSRHYNTITSNAEGAALGLALWAALYNSTAIGTVSASGRFSVSGASAEIASTFNSDLAEVNSAGQSDIQSVYDTGLAKILRPVNGSLQDMIIDPSGASSTDPSPLAPEPSSFFALAALLAMTGAKWLWQPIGRFFGQRKGSEATAEKRNRK